MLPSRIFDRVSIGGLDACWWWKGAPNSRGYGTVRVNGKTERIHRVVYEHFRGPIPAGHLLHHACEEKLCVNPRHLVPLIPRDHKSSHNGSTIGHCKNGHPYNEENTYWSKKGWRY